MKKRSKRYKEIKKQSVRNTKLKINEAIDLVKKTTLKEKKTTHQGGFHHPKN